MSTGKRIITESAFNQLGSSMQMLKILVDVCEDDVWHTVYYGHPFWYHVYHVAYFIDYWLREYYSNSSFKSMEFNELIPPEFKHPVDSSLSICRADMLEYVHLLFIKSERFFARLDDKRLSQPAVGDRHDLTYADVIMTQLRHIMYNIGYLNGILRGLGLQESDWFAYNEND